MVIYKICAIILLIGLGIADLCIIIIKNGGDLYDDRNNNLKLVYGSDYVFLIFSFCSASFRATICVIFILAMIRMTLAKKKAKKMGYKHIVSLPSCWSLSQLPNLISILGSLVILIILFVLSIHKKRITTEGDADVMNLWTYGADYIVQTLTTFILLYVIRKTVLNLLIKERQDTI